jgi:hypothetical protein
MKYSNSKEINQLISNLVKGGWEYSRGKRHGKLKEPLSKHILTVPISPSDYRAFLNFRRDVRQYVIGLQS